MLDVMERTNVRVGHGAPIGVDRIWFSGTTEVEPEARKRMIAICLFNFYIVGVCLLTIYTCFAKRGQYRMDRLHPCDRDDPMEGMLGGQQTN